ncbi:unnamed protein product [Spodoptera exigua]|nr:unnamed protein product [Spodoptera exigua]
MTHRVCERRVLRWDGDRHAAGAGGRAKAGRQATYLLIRPRRKSPCIYFELACAGVGTGGGGRGAGRRRCRSGARRIPQRPALPAPSLEVAVRSCRFSVANN